MSWILVGVAAVGAASGIMNAQKMRSAAELQEKLNEVNAKYAELDAYKAEVYGETLVAASEKNTTNVIADQRTGFAAANVDVNYGSAKAIQDETELTGFLNSLEIQNQARQQAAGFRREARNIRTGASVQRQQADLNADAMATSSVINSVSGYASAKGRGY